MGWGSFRDSITSTVTGSGGSSFDEIGNMIRDPLDLTGVKAGAASEKAAAAAVGGQQAQLDYLREIDKMPREYRDKALADLYTEYTGPQEDQQVTIDRAKSSPLYAEIMGGREAGEESIMRQAGATGGLRSGNVQSNMYDYNTQLANQALTQSYNQQQQEEERRLSGLKGLAQIPTGEQQIGQSMSDIGMTQAMGITGAAQTAQQNQQSNMNLGMGILSMFI